MLKRHEICAPHISGRDIGGINPAKSLWGFCRCSDEESFPHSGNAHSQRRLRHSHHCLDRFWSNFLSTEFWPTSRLDIPDYRILWSIRRLKSDSIIQKAGSLYMCQWIPPFHGTIHNIENLARVLTALATSLKMARLGEGLFWFTSCNLEDSPMMQRIRESVWILYAYQSRFSPRHPCRYLS